MTAAARYEALIPDINGIFRGLSLTGEDGATTEQSGFSITGSLFCGRFDGSVAEETGYGIKRGDPDHPCVLVDGTSAPVPWRGGDRQGVYRMLSRDGGKPFELDPQTVLDGVLEKFTANNWQVFCAVELEFYLHDEKQLQTIDAQSGAAPTHLYAMEHKKDEVLRAITQAAQAQHIAAGSIINEYGPGQWEINLHHTHPMRAALDGLLFRRTVRAVAQQFGQQATFMAKPYSGFSGSGMHIHCSVIAKDGRNIFNDKQQKQNAIAGVLAVMPEAMAFFAPFDNSYRRLMPDKYAPLFATYGEDDRAAALRIPADDGNPNNTRLECRVAGADANPLLVISAMLIGIHYGICHRPPLPKQPAALPPTWRHALDALAQAKILPKYIKREFLSVYGKVKENEWQHHRNYVSDYDRLFYHPII